MKKLVTGILGLILLAVMVAIMLTGCASTANKVTASASGKNLNLDGYVMLGELETANSETATPQGKMIIGRVTYKSRKVGIPADQKVPLSGYFKKTKTKSLFGTEEEILEMDFTAGSDAEAEKALETLKRMKTAENQTELNGENKENGSAGADVKTAK